jgi:cytochrome P450
MTDTTADRANVDLEDFNLFDPAVQQCPHAYYAKMQAEQPVFPAEVMGTTVHLITRYEDALEVVRYVDTFSSQFDTTTGGGAKGELYERMKVLYAELDGYPTVSTMLTADAPDHTRYRRLVSKAFTPKVINDLEPVIREITSRLIDAWIESGADGIEFVEQFAVPLPVTVIAKALNVPDDRLADFKRWSDGSIAGIGTNISIDERITAEREVIAYQHYFAEQINLRRTEPQDDILTNLLNARIDKNQDPDLPDELLTMAEMLGIIQQLLVAGNETTTKMLTEMMRLLGENPDQFQQLQENPARARLVVEEALRLSTPTQGMWRVATKDTVVNGVEIKAGARVVVMFASANRDPELFDHPDDFDPDRDGLGNHIAFGKGVHYCLGAALSRLEGRVVAEELSLRIREFTLDESNKFAYHPSFMLRGLTDLHLHFTKAD